MLEGTPNNVASQWTPTLAWTPSLLNWVENGAYTYSQHLNIAGMQLYQPSIEIMMDSTAMANPDLSPSCTFSSAHINIFSNFSQVTINNGQKCVGPFSYVYLDSHSVWTVWCEVSVDSVNEILIGYPFYPNIIGSGFPFSQTFTYQYSNTAGRMIGYRVEQDSTYTPQTCTTIKETEYYLVMPTSQ